MDDEIDFKEALTIGLAAADDAAQAMREVESVIADAAESVKAVTSNKLSLFLGPTTVEKINLWTSNAIKSLGLEPKPYVIKLHAVFVGHLMHHADKSSTIERPEVICLVRFGDRTYPLSIEWEDVNSSCSDKRELRVVLSRVLKDPRVARTIGRVIASYPTDRQQIQIGVGVRVGDDAVNAQDKYKAAIVDSAHASPSKDVDLNEGSTTQLKNHIGGAISIGMAFDSYFELRIPIRNIQGIPICRVPYSDVEWADVTSPNRLSLKLRSPIIWDGSELRFG